MKKLISAVAGVACLVATSFGQGSVNFSTIGLGTSAQVYDTDGTTLLAGAAPQNGNFFVQLYAAAGTGVASSSLVAVGIPVNFFGGGGAGYVQSGGQTSLGATVNSAVTIPFISPAGGPVTIQMRAWWGNPNGSGGQFTSFDTYKADVTAQGQQASARWGWSNVINLNQTGSSGGLPPVTLTGLSGFNLQQTFPVPEPGTLAFGAIGSLSLLLFRRRK